MSAKETEVLQRIREVAHRFVPKGGRALLYGSRARGDAHKGSDWDVLIILNKNRISPNDYDTVSFPFVSLGWDINEEINPIMYTQSEWEKYDFTPFYENVEHDGITL
ncbi:MAG: nucleotidyltransferase domain-containing protein [Bacteroidaceae bacterium]|nr:nucleotidyltransferase domain-containing protein [Bacteroidaceae bacterium]